MQENIFLYRSNPTFTDFQHRQALVQHCIFQLMQEDIFYRPNPIFIIFGKLLSVIFALDHEQGLS
jgi:hypothetical protein